MSIDVMSPSSSKERPATSKKPAKATAKFREPSVREIIENARADLAPAWGTWCLSGLTGVLFWCSFTPVEFAALGWLCLVPLICLIRLERRTKFMYRAIFLASFVTMLATLQWMRHGDPSMYLAWIALSLYMALYFPLFVSVSRVAVNRFHVPLLITVPVMWTGLEFIRSNLMTGFGWYNLAHTQYRWIELIQISDIVGAYGVSFIIAMSAGCLAGLVPMRWLSKLKLTPPLNLPDDFKHLPKEGAVPEKDRDTSLWRRAMPVLVNLSIIGAVLGYGHFRMQTEFTDGPRIALIQCNFTASLKHDVTKWERLFVEHNKLTGAAVKHQPHIIVWPETMFRWPMYEIDLEMTDAELKALVPSPKIDPDKWLRSLRDQYVQSELAEMSQQANAAMIIGLDAVVARKDGIRRYNSAVYVDPQNGVRGRYDKMHRVAFGEYIPFKEQLPWLHKVTPFPADFGIAKGDHVAIFQIGDWRVAPVICFEDTVPHVVRKIVHSGNDNNRGIDCLINLTNDGWFHGSSELDQHLITAAFRSIECRTPMVRAVNTGISAIIDGNGMIVEPEVFIDGDVYLESGKEKMLTMKDPKTGGWHKQRSAVLVHNVPLDSRNSLYVRFGDWFAGACCFFTLLIGLCCLVPKRKPEEQLA